MTTNPYLLRSALTWTLALGTALSTGCGRPAAQPRTPTSELSPVGAAWIAKRPPPNELIAINAKGEHVQPSVVDGFSQLPTSHKFWAQAIWHYDPNNVEAMFAHPLVFKSERDGLGLSYPTEPIVNEREFAYRYDEDIRVVVEGLKNEGPRVKRYGDFTATIVYGAHGELEATMGHGLPFVYFEVQAGKQVTLRRPDRGKVKCWATRGAACGFTSNGHHYGAFAPPGVSWREGKGGLSLRGPEGGGTVPFSVAVLPAADVDTLSFFQKHAHAFVRDSRVSWNYDEATAQLHATFSVTTENVAPCPTTQPASPPEQGPTQATVDEPNTAGEPDAADEPDTGAEPAPPVKPRSSAAAPAGCSASDVPMLALYRHQWLNAQADFLPHEYVSPRGKMKTLATKSFATSSRFTGVLPILPDVGAYKNRAMRRWLSELRGQKEFFPLGLGEAPNHDAYWEGKNFGKLTTGAMLAEQAGDLKLRDKIVAAMKTRLEDWFDGQMPRMFHYDETWRSLLAFPASYGSAAELNDHHFHYGYFVWAATYVALHDRGWAERYEPMIETLIRDGANWERSGQFPFLRYMDVYAGHSWASGHGAFLDGNNQESSSEDVNFSNSLILWGSVMGNREIRDLGIFLKSQQVAAVEQYWFDVDNAVFPEEFDHPTVAMVWGDGARYDTWFDQDPWAVHGINWLPLTGGSLYLGHHPEYVEKNFDILLERHQGELVMWRDYGLMFLALADGDRALKLLLKDRHLPADYGNTRAMIHHFIRTLADVGQFDASVSADLPTFAVFRKGSVRTYAAFNPSAAPISVRFSDGATLDVPPQQIAHKKQPISVSQ